MADKNYHTFTVNGRVVSEKEYDTHARYMDKLNIAGQDLYRRQRAQNPGVPPDEVLDALLGMGKKYTYDPEDPLKKAKGGPVRSKRKPRDGIAVSGLTRAPDRRT